MLSPFAPTSSTTGMRPAFPSTNGTANANANANAAAHDLAAVYSTYVVRVHTRHGIQTISFQTLATYFTCTAKKAAEELGISSRTLIRVCRSLGIRRWPYLGFRSEKNVERIRHEAIENLRRKLEHDGGADTSAPVLHAAASCLRGASAKRLLQVKLPPVAVSKPHHLQRFPRVAVATNMPPNAVSAPPLLAPPATHEGFRLDLLAPNPKPMRLPPLQPPTMHPIFDHAPPKTEVGSPEPMIVDSEGPAALPPHMPALNVLVDASILTAFKHEMETKVAQEEAHHARSMSMRDILSQSQSTRAT